jgi:hypothetical protein
MESSIYNYATNFVVNRSCNRLTKLTNDYIEITHKLQTIADPKERNCLLEELMEIQNKIMINCNIIYGESKYYN